MYPPPTPCPSNVCSMMSNRCAQDGDGLFTLWQLAIEKMRHEERVAQTGNVDDAHERCGTFLYFADLDAAPLALHRPHPFFLEHVALDRSIHRWMRLRAALCNSSDVGRKIRFPRNADAIERQRATFPLFLLLLREKQNIFLLLIFWPQDETKGEMVHVRHSSISKLVRPSVSPWNRPMINW